MLMTYKVKVAACSEIRKKKYSQQKEGTM